MKIKRQKQARHLLNTYRNVFKWVLFILYWFMKWAYLFWQWLQKELPVGSLTLKPSAYSTTY